MEPVFYVSVVGNGGAKSHEIAERAFIERAQNMGYQPVKFAGDSAETSEYSHVNTSGAVAAISSVAADRALSRIKSENPRPFEERARNVDIIASVLKSMDASFNGVVVNVINGG